MISSWIGVAVAARWRVLMKIPPVQLARALFPHHARLGSTVPVNELHSPKFLLLQPLVKLLQRLVQRAISSRSSGDKIFKVTSSIDQLGFTRNPMR